MKVFGTCVLSCARSSSDDDRQATTEEMTSSSMTDDLICRLSMRSLISSKISANDPSALSSRERTLAKARVASLLTLRPFDLNERKIFRSMVDDLEMVMQELLPESRCEQGPLQKVNKACRKGEFQQEQSDSEASRFSSLVFPFFFEFRCAGKPILTSKERGTFFFVTNCDYYYSYNGYYISL